MYLSPVLQAVSFSILEGSFLWQRKEIEQTVSLGLLNIKKVDAESMMA